MRGVAGVAQRYLQRATVGGQKRVDTVARRWYDLSPDRPQMQRNDAVGFGTVKEPLKSYFGLSGFFMGFEKNLEEPCKC